MNASEVNLFMKAYSYVQNLILWSKGQRFGSSWKSSEDLAHLATQEYQADLNERVTFAIACIECVYQFIPLYERDAKTGVLGKPRYALGLCEEFATEIAQLLPLTGAGKDEIDVVTSEIILASERGWNYFSSK
jgi:hypothetical protein